LDPSRASVEGWDAFLLAGFTGFFAARLLAAGLAGDLILPLADALADKGNQPEARMGIEQCIQQVLTVKDGLDRAIALFRVATAQRRMGDRSGAESTRDQADKAAREAEWRETSSPSSNWKFLASTRVPMNGTICWPLLNACGSRYGIPTQRARTNRPPKPPRSRVLAAF
jgi:hypothetical protein